MIGEEGNKKRGGENQRGRELITVTAIAKQGQLTASTLEYKLSSSASSSSVWSLRVREKQGGKKNKTNGCFCPVVILVTVICRQQYTPSVSRR